MLFITMVNMMRVLPTHETLGVGNKINVNMIKVWHKIIKLWVDNFEGICLYIRPLYWNENNVQHDGNVAHNDDGWDD
jgi:Na+-translocating ferredoxin:NAD+ oxidoreductase RnfG subunit